MAWSFRMFHHPPMVAGFRRTVHHGRRRIVRVAQRVWFAVTLVVVVPAVRGGATESRPTVAPRDAAAEANLKRRGTWLRRHPASDPVAALALIGLAHQLGGEVASERLLEFVRRVTRDSKRDPLVRSVARSQEARILERAGKIDEARRLLEEDGYLLAWQYVGPFDNASGRGHHREYPPEVQPFSQEQTFRGKPADHPLGWRVYDVGYPGAGYVSFDEFIRPNSDVVAYATTWVHVPGRVDAALHLGASGAYQAWVNGRPVGTGDRYGAAHPLQEVHAVRLHPGWNRLLLKVAVLSGPWGFYARLSRADGRPLEATVSVEPRGGLELGETSADEVDFSTRSLRAILESRYRRNPKAGLELLDFYRWVQPFAAEDRTPAITAAAVDEALQTSETAWLRALLDSESNRARYFLEVAIDRARTEHSPRLPGLLLDLAWREGALGLEHNGQALIDEAVSLAPDDVEVVIAALDSLESYGFRWSLLRRNQELVAKNPHSRTARESLARRFADLGRIDQALEILNDLADLEPTDRGLAIQRIDLQLRRGRADEAVAIARELARRLPGLPAAHDQVARLEAGRGDLVAARAAQARALSLAPLDPELHATMGHLLLRAGDRTGALDSLRKSLHLRPQQPLLADLVESLDGGASRTDLWNRYGVSLAKVGSISTPDAWKDKDAGILHQRIAVRVLSNGLTERLDHRIIRIIDDRGVRTQAVQSLTYDPAESMVEVRRARVRRRDGTVEEIGEPRTLALAQAGYRLYYDQREFQVHFRGLRPGDTLEVAFLQRDIAASNKFHDYFGDLVALSGVAPRRLVEYVLEAPADKPLHFNVEVERAPAADGKSIVYRHARRDLPAIRVEQGMPGWTEVASYLHVSTARDWRDIGHWYWNLVKEQLVVDEAIRAGVHETIRGLSDVPSKVRALYRHVVRSTRYVGLEFGIHGYKPYRTSDVYARRFGDCKDKASLLKVMLEEAGIRAHLVLLRTRDQGTITSAPASVAAFNHAIVYVPEENLYLDGTAEWSGAFELPANDQGATALIVEDGGEATLTVIPFAEANANVRRNDIEARIGRDGSARLDHRLHVTGADASQLRYLLSAEEERRERVMRIWGQLFPGAEVEQTAAPGIEDILQPVRLRAQLKVPSFARLDRGRLRFRTLGRSSGYVESLAPQSKRTHDLVLGVPSREEEHIVYELEPGLRFIQVPSSKRIETPLGSFVLEIDVSDRRARVTSTMEFGRARIRPQEYAQFRRFLADVDAALGQTFEVERSS